MESFKVKQASLAFSQIRMARHARKQQMRKHTRNKDEQPITSRYDPFLYLSMILGANFSSESGPEIPLNVSLLIRFGGQLTTKKGTT